MDLVMAIPHTLQCDADINKGKERKDLGWNMGGVMVMMSMSAWLFGS